MERLQPIARSLRAAVERRQHTAVSSAGSMAAPLLRWIESQGLDGELLIGGWELGVAAQGRTDALGGLLDRVMDGERVVLEAADEASREGELAFDAVDALTLARWLRAGTLLLTRTALKGFIAGREAGHRSWLRTLRHDLRNPIGAIKNAMALLEETTPPEAASGRIYGIAARNVATLESMVRLRAADDADRAAIEWSGRTRPADVVGRILDDLRLADGVAERVAVGRLPATHVDALGLELCLRAGLSAVLCEQGTSVVVEQASDDEHPEAANGGASSLADDPPDVLVTVRPAAAGEAIGRRATLAEFAGRVAESCGGRAATTAAGALVIAMPPLVELASGGRAAGEERHDLGRGGERGDRQPGAL